MKKTFLLITLLSVTAVFAPLVSAQDTDEQIDYPWEKFSISAGGFVSTLDSSVRYGTSIGININVEDALGLEGDQTVFRLDSAWRFTENRKHRVDASWFYFHRNASRVLGDDITIEDPNDPDGPPIVIPAETLISASLNWDIYKVNYSYSFFQDDRMDLAGQVGLFIMPVEFGLSTSGTFDERVEVDITAPLPTLGARLDFAITPKWIFRTSAEYFYLKYDTFKGFLMHSGAAIEYKPWERWGFGLGIESFRTYVKSREEDWPGIDLRGEVEMNYVGLKFYVKYFFQ
jgi:hypothetical protein